MSPTFLRPVGISQRKLSDLINRIFFHLNQFDILQMNPERRYIVKTFGGSTSGPGNSIDLLPQGDLLEGWRRENGYLVLDEVHDIWELQGII